MTSPNWAMDEGELDDTLALVSASLKVCVVAWLLGVAGCAAGYESLVAKARYSDACTLLRRERDAPRAEEHGRALGRLLVELANIDAAVRVLDAGEVRVLVGELPVAYLAGSRLAVVEWAYDAGLVRGLDSVNFYSVATKGEDGVVRVSAEFGTGPIRVFLGLPPDAERPARASFGTVVGRVFSIAAGLAVDVAALATLGIVNLSPRDCAQNAPGFTCQATQGSSIAPATQAQALSNLVLFKEQVDACSSDNGRTRCARFVVLSPRASSSETDYQQYLGGSVNFYGESRCAVDVALLKPPTPR